MRRLWIRLERAHTARWGPRRMTMGAALLLALLALALATQGRFLHPTGYGLSLAAQVVDARRSEADLNQQIRQLQEVYEFLQTSDGRELAARAEVQALKPGERLIILSEAARQAKEPQTVAERINQGLENVGEVVVDRLRYTKEVLQVWSGVGESRAEASPTRPNLTAKPAPSPKPATRN